MKIAVFTLTRDRLEYTQKLLPLLREKAGVPFDHYIVDNGSQDGTQEWLKGQDFKKVIYNYENMGISAATNQALDEILKGDYDLIVKMDNDCEVVSDNILGQIAEIYEDIRQFSPAYVLSPRVEGIMNQPNRSRYEMLAGRRIGITGIVGGLFRVMPRKILEKYREPLDLPKAWGQDDNFARYVSQNGGLLGYIEGLVVNHYETTNGQAQRFPDYFKRKFEEQK